MTQLVSFPAQLFSVSIFGILLGVFLDFSTIIIFLTAALAAAGMDWLIQSHPTRIPSQNRWANVRHWIVPVLTTLVIGVALNTFAGSSFWWAIFILGSLLLLAVLIAEYNVVTADDFRHPMAAVGLTALSFALYLLLTIAVFSANLRLFIRLPILGIGAMMVVSRSLYLRLGHWEPIWALVSSLVISEIVVGFHYLPFSPMRFGLLLVGAAYALTSLVAAIKEARKSSAFWSEPVIMFVIMIIVSLFWR